MKVSKIQLAREAFRHKGFIRKLPVIIRMVKSAMTKGGYRPQFKNAVVIGLVLIYLLTPIDIIPDWIPVVGVLDDLALLAMAMPMLIAEAERFTAWEAERKERKQISEAEIVG